MRWLVDGMNVIGSRPDGWWKDRDAAMAGLVDRLERWAATTEERITVVFDRRPSPPISSPILEVTHAPRPDRDGADDEIASRLASDPEPGEIVVVTSDRRLAARARAAGAGVESAAPFRRRIEKL